MARCVLALDQGTTSSRALLFDEQRQILGLSQFEFSQSLLRRRGPVTEKLQTAFFRILKDGEDPHGWLTPVPVAEAQV